MARRHTIAMPFRCRVRLCILQRKTGSSRPAQKAQALMTAAGWEVPAISNWERDADVSCETSSCVTGTGEGLVFARASVYLSETETAG